MSKRIWLVLGLSFAVSACGDDLPFERSPVGDDPMDDGSGGGSDGGTDGGTDDGSGDGTDDGSGDGLDGPTCGAPDPASVSLDEEEQRFLELLNEHRANNGRAPVVACTSLNRAAQRHSEDMRDQDYFSHDGLDGSSPGSRACDACFESCQRTGFGENIAAGNSDAESTFNQWVSSSGHNANMLRESYVVVGLGRATGGGQYRSYWTNVFAATTDPSCGN